jgi:hypothetical protein
MGGLGGDNMSIIIICCLNGKPWQDLVDKCKRIHSEKKATSKLCEPAFSALDRFTSEGPFAEVSVLKAASDELSNANETSSSSHTSSPSSSPISTEEKFELPETSQAPTTTTTNESEDGAKKEKEELVNEEILPKLSQNADENSNQNEVVKEIENGKAKDDENPAPLVASEETVVSNGD